MYIPKWHREHDPAVLHAIMRQNPFATLVTTGADGVPFATHLPFVLTVPSDAGQPPSSSPLPGLGEGPGVRALLRAHLARANPQWEHFAAGREALVIFQGPHAYISPAWYAAQPAVPTWNYAVVHAYGVPRVLEDEALFALLRDVVAQHEADPSALDMPEEFVRKMMRGVVGFDLPLTRLEGKLKMSQNRSTEDRERVIAALEAGGEDGTAQWMRALSSR